MVVGGHLEDEGELVVLPTRRKLSQNEVDARKEDGKRRRERLTAAESQHLTICMC